MSNSWCVRYRRKEKNGKLPVLIIYTLATVIREFEGLNEQDGSENNDTCHSLSQSSGIGQAPNHAPITALWAGRQTMYSISSLGLKAKYRRYYTTQITQILLPNHIWQSLGKHTNLIHRRERQCHIVKYSNEQSSFTHLLCLSKYPVPVSPRGTKNRSCWDILPTIIRDLYGTEEHII